MSFILIMIIVNGSAVSSQSVKFYSQTACLKAMQQVVELETRFVVKATCVAESL